MSSPLSNGSVDDGSNQHHHHHHHNNTVSRSAPLHSGQSILQNHNNKRVRDDSLDGGGGGGGGDGGDSDVVRKKRMKLEEMKSQLENYLERLQAALTAERDRMRSISTNFSASSSTAPVASSSSHFNPQSSSATAVPAAVSTYNAPPRRAAAAASASLSSSALAAGVGGSSSSRRSSGAVGSQKSKIGRKTTKKDDEFGFASGVGSSSSSIVPVDTLLPEDTKTQLFKSCSRVLEDLAKHPKYDVFAIPVDWVALKIPDYPKIIKNPMDLGTIRQKLTSGKYENIYEFQADVMLVWYNAKTFNPSGHVVHTWACQLQDLFEKKFKHVEREMKRIEKKVVEIATSVAAAKPKSEAAKKPKKPPQPKVKSLTFAEKQKLGENLRKVPADQLIHIAEIINAKPRPTEDGPQELEIEMDQLDAPTLRKLQEFVKSVIPSKSKSKKSSSAPPAPAVTGSSVPNVTPAVPVGMQPDIVHESDDSGNDTNSSSSFDSDLSSDDENSKPSAHATSGKAPAASYGSSVNNNSGPGGAPGDTGGNESKDDDGLELWKDLKSVAHEHQADEHGNGGVLQDQQIREMDEERQRQMQQQAAVTDGDDDMEDVVGFADWAHS